MAAALDHVGEELREEGRERQADVHAVHIGVGGDDDLRAWRPSISSMLGAACSRLNSSFS